VYERKLVKNKVKVFSITQQTSDDSAEVRRAHSLPVDQFKANQVEVFAKTLKAKLLAKDSALSKSYL